MKLKLFTFLFSIISLTGFSQWVKLSTPDNSPLYAVSFLDADNGMVGGSGGTLFITEDGGESWWIPMSCPQEDFYCVYMLSTQVMFIGGNNLYRSSDGGGSWTQVSDMSSPRSISFTDAMHGKCTGVSGIYETYDGGVTWIAVPTGNTSIFESVQSFDTTDITMGNVGGMVSYSAVARRTQDGIWYDCDVMSFPNSNAWTCSHFPTPDTGFVFLNEYSHWIPSDLNQLVRVSNFILEQNFFGDFVWYFYSEIVNEYLPDYMTSAYFLDNNKGYACGELGSIYYTSNGGIDWEVDYSGTVTLTEMQFLNDNLAFAVGYDGTVLKHEVTTNSNDLMIDKAVSLYPNPASGKCIISDIQGASVIELVAVSGQLAGSYKCNGTEEAEISLSGVKPGIYMVKVTDNDGSVRISKLMVQ